MTNVARISDFQPPKAISTAEDAKALRSLSSYPAWREPSLNEARRWISPAVRAALPAGPQEAEAMLQPAIVADGKRYLGPCPRSHGADQHDRRRSNDLVLRGP